MNNYLKYAGLILLSVVMGGCEGQKAPDSSGEIKLSSQFFGTESYYVFGYNFEESDYFKYYYPSNPGATIPDIINEGIRNVQGDNLLPGFNTPSQVNGFALSGQFETLAEARAFYNSLTEAGQDLQFSVISDTVKLYQVWIQKTRLGNYAKLLVKDIQIFEDNSGSKYNEVTLDFSYQQDGSRSFPD